MSIDDPPTPTAIALAKWERRPLAFGPALRAFGEAALMGLAFAIADVLSSGSHGPGSDGFARLLAGVILGFRHARRAWICWLPLGASLYLVHFVAILGGAKPPHVEADLTAARVALQQIFPAAWSLALGASIRRVPTVLGLFTGHDGPPPPLLPKTIKGALLAVMGVGLALGLMRWVAFDSMTVYAPGYDEGRFRSVRPGMTAVQVEAILGEPLIRLAANRGDEVWRYTSGATGASNHWRRWVFLKAGKVDFTLSDFFWDD